MLKYGVRKLFAPGCLLRYKSTHVAPLVLENISRRGLLRVSGPETSVFLQGLITNDMRRLDDGATSMYAMFLNTKGRVMYDVMLYKSQEKNVYYVECDSRAVPVLKNHLKLYRVRRKVDIDDVVESTKVWALFNPESDVDREPTVSPVVKSVSNDVSIYSDPRLTNIGYRVLTNCNVESQDVIKSIDYSVIQSNDMPRYRVFRYKLGIGEGCDDVEPNKAFPLEMNCDYLNGVSFQKGCYIGQELTARAFHTGVIRKRLMPVIFDDVPSTTLDIDQTITDESGRSVGKLKGHDKIYGLGLIRITEGLRAKSLHVANNHTCKVIKPWWWPRESITEKVSAR